MSRRVGQNVSSDADFLDLDISYLNLESSVLHLVEDMT